MSRVKRALCYEDPQCSSKVSKIGVHGRRCQQIRRVSMSLTQRTTARTKGTLTERNVGWFCGSAEGLPVSELMIGFLFEWSGCRYEASRWVILASHLPPEFPHRRCTPAGLNTQWQIATIRFGERTNSLVDRVKREFTFLCSTDFDDLWFRLVGKCVFQDAGNSGLPFRNPCGIRFANDGFSIP